MNLLGNYGSDDEDFVVGAPTPHTTVNGRTHAHLLILFWYYLLTNPDLALTERPAKKAKTIFADLSEDDRDNARKTHVRRLQLEVQHSGALPEGRRLDRILHLL